MGTRGWCGCRLSGRARMDRAADPECKAHSSRLAARSMNDTTVSTLPIQRRFYYGWTIVGVAALAMVGTLPGRTQGLGLITEPLLADLGLSRVAYAQVNLIATLIGALFAFGV